MKKIISILLAVMLVVSVAVVSAGAYNNDGDYSKINDGSSYNPKDSYTVDDNTPTCEEAIDACGGNSKTGVQYIYFQLPQPDPNQAGSDWANKFNTDANGVCQVCAYWWGGIAGSASEGWSSGKGCTWVGYRTTLVDADNRIYRAAVPNDGNTPLIIWGNGVNGGMDPTKEIFNYARQIADANIEGADDSLYDTLPEGTPNYDENMDGCISIVSFDESRAKVNPLTGFLNYDSDWYVYYGDGCYGYYPTTSENFRGKQASCVNPEHNHIIGDVNSDTIVDIMDVLTLQYALAGKELPEGMVYKEGSADVDGDGYISIIDATRIQRYLAQICNIDGSNLRQLTSGPWNEFDPCWLPNGRIVFSSERRGGFVRCSGMRPVPSYTLHSMLDDGTDIVRLSHHETNEWHPSVNNDGMIVYTRWDYVDRGAGQAHHAWTCFPDGRDPREVNGNTRLHANTTPKMEMNVRQIPNSRKYIATATPHHGWAAGSFILIDPSIPDDGEMSAVRRVTPEQAFPESEQITGHNRHSGSYATAWPLSEKYFICAYDGDANGMYKVSMRGRRYAITLVDVFGNKTRLYTHPGTSCLDPMPLIARKRPPVIPHKTLEGAPRGWVYPENPVKTGEIGLINVYDTRIPFPTNDAITALRVWQLFPKTKPVQQRPWLGAENRQTGRQCLGTVPVEKDGSAYFTAPVGVPLFFQALRADGCAVQNMRSDTYLHPGERLMCAGCHEPKENTRRAAFSSLPLAMRRAPSAIKPGPDGSAPFNYARLVQPVLDAKCVSCHGEKRAPKAPDLRAGDWRKDRWGFSTSWKNLVHRTNYFVREIIEDGRRVNWEFFEPAYTTPGRNLAIGAPLRKMLDAGHHGVKLTPEERERLILWMDSNGQYIAHDHDPEAQRDGKIVKPSLE